MCSVRTTGFVPDYRTGRTVLRDKVKLIVNEYGVMKSGVYDHDWVSIGVSRWFYGLPST